MNNQQILELENKHLSDLFQKNAQLIEAINRISSLENQLREALEKNLTLIDEKEELTRQLLSKLEAQVLDKEAEIASIEKEIDGVVDNDLF